MKIKLHATPEEVMRGVELLQEFARRQGVPEQLIFGLALALEECGSNVVNHGLGRDPSRSFTVSCEFHGDLFTIELRDAGPPFDPTAAAPSRARAEDDAPGGWGIELVRRYMDQICYTREGLENVLRLVRRIPPAQGG